MKLSCVALLLPVLASAAILPDTIGPYRKTASSAARTADAAVWAEYGLKESETARYENGGAAFTLDAYRMPDPTGALAVFDWQRPANATQSKAAALAAETPDSLMVAEGNYLLSFKGYKPAEPELAALTGALRNLDTSSLPTLPGFLPSQDLVPNSERYITGPASLQKFAPGIPPSVAAFRLDSEAQAGVFHSPKGDMSLVIFDYPTPQIAMAQTAEFEKLPGARVKRSGPLVAVVLSPPDPDAAERLLAAVRYQAQITRNEYVPTQRDNIGDLLLTISVLIGLVLCLGIFAGLALGGFRVLMRYARKGEEPEAMITLHLERR
jgi:hypothetical protein